MKICLFYPENVFASWYACGGYVSCLRRMGHEVLNVPFPGNCYQKNSAQIQDIKYPLFHDINSCDVVILAYLEHIHGWLETIYGIESWEKHIEVPVIARFDESFDRTDLGLPSLWNYLKRWAKYYSFPAIQDAEQFGGDWLPYGADTDIFTPYPGFLQKEKAYRLAFIGTMYLKRTDYARNLLLYLKVPFNHNTVLIQDLSGFRFRDQTELLAENYRQIKVFFCLPPMSNLLVCKVFEAMACGAFMMFPRLQGKAAKNLEIFEDKKHLVYYELGNFKENVDQIHYWIENQHEREAIASNGCEEVLTEYTLERMFEKLLAPVTTSSLSSWIQDIQETQMI